MKKFNTKDSGKRMMFKSGMKREPQEGKPRFDLIYQPMLKRWAEVMSRGVSKYGDRDWEKANSEEELNKFKASAYRHFYQWFNGESPEEDHAASIMFNISAVEMIKEKLNNGKRKKA